jgi:polyphosphate kinase
VLAIKQTIYRVGSNSPIVEELTRAAVNGKQVSTLIELKARFDEENNIEWARALEKTGVHVVYGSIELKTHCKVVLVVRKDHDGIRRYVHLSTGNYNAKTARSYTDLGLFTCNPEIGADVSTLFNALTGYSFKPNYRKLLVSPHGVRAGLFNRIEREIEHAKAGRPARIIFKINALVDFASVDMLYKASQAGVQVDLVVRTQCCLQPGIPDLSENIHVTSIVGRYLEHSRIYYFSNGGDEAQSEIYLGSADLMQRNLDHRVETLFPIENVALKQHIYEEILLRYLRDNQKARVLLPDGRYDRVLPTSGAEPFEVQEWFSKHSVDDSLLSAGVK